MNVTASLPLAVMFVVEAVRVIGFSGSEGFSGVSGVSGVYGSSPSFLTMIVISLDFTSPFMAYAV